MATTETRQDIFNVVPEGTPLSEGTVRSHGPVRNGHISSQTVRRTAAGLLLAIGLAACGGSEVVADSETFDERWRDRQTADAIFSGESADVEDAADSPDIEDTAPEAIAFADSADDVASDDVAANDDDAGSDSDDAAPIVIDSPPSPPGAPANHSVLDDGRIFLRGTVPTEEISELTVVAFEAILGEGNAIAEFTIDPSVDFDSDQSQAIFLADAVLFETGSAEVTDDFADILSFSPLLLEAHPASTLWAFGHTDSVGSAESNLELSQNRVDAVADWIIEQGGDPERIFPEGVGEDQPIADNSTEEGRAQNRRVEFIVDSFDIGI